MREEIEKRQVDDGCQVPQSFENVESALFDSPLKGCLKQVRAYGLINTENKLEPKFRQVTIGLCIHHPEFPDIELIVNPSEEGVSLIIPKAINLSNVQLMRAFKRPCGALQVEFKAQSRRVIRREHSLKPHQTLLGRQ